MEFDTQNRVNLMFNYSFKLLSFIYAICIFGLKIYEIFYERKQNVSQFLSVSVV